MTSHRILTMTHDAVWRTLSTLEDSKGCILLREEYTLLYDRLLSPFGDYCSGVLVKGQPGIGEHVSRTHICTIHQFDEVSEQGSHIFWYTPTQTHRRGPTGALLDIRRLHAPV